MSLDERRPLRGFLDEEGYGTLREGRYQGETSQKRHAFVKKLAAGIAVLAICCFAATAMIAMSPASRSALLQVIWCLPLHSSSWLHPHDVQYLHSPWQAFTTPAQSSHPFLFAVDQCGSIDMTACPSDLPFHVPWFCRIRRPETPSTSLLKLVVRMARSSSRSCKGCGLLWSTRAQKVRTQFKV